MERLGERDRVLLGYSCSDPLRNLHRPPQHHRNSDVEFADVFGGPPRRSSFYETRRSRADSLDARARPPPPSTEKPAFGELGIPARRRLLGDDFYDDILPGSEFRPPTPRKLDRDPFPSSPGSRILSPNRPVFVGASSLPPQLSIYFYWFNKHGYSSLPKTKLANSVDGDFDNSSFLHSPTTSRAVPVHGDLRTLDHAFYRQSPLASQLSCGISRSSETFSKGSLSERYAPSLEGYFNNNQFHFSIYRWAGKGLSLSLSSLSEKTNVTGRYGRFPEVVIQSVELPSDDDDYMPTSPGISNNQTINHKNKVINDIFSVSKHEADLSFPEYLSELDPNYLSKSYTGNAGSETLNEHEKEDGGQQDATDGFRVKLQKQRQNSEHAGSISPRMEDIPVSLEEKMHKQHGSRVKGRAKGFIKIFNIEGSFSKRKGIFESGESKSKEKDRVKSKVGVQVSTLAAEANDKVKAVPPHDGPSVIYPVEVNEMLESEGIPSLYMSSNVPITKDPSPEWSKTSGPSCKNNNVPACKFEESHFEDLEACLVEQLPQKQLKDEQSASKHEEIAIANRKIQEWSKGKEGNIRSLLSTLQYVLWSGSGWKPVPLVDIIEGPSVKRAYQKALLCLHPDKLQQRGAAEHQKYIAEKVFDILQEAWDQFNSLSDAF